MSTPLRGNWSYPTTIRFGEGRITELADACREAGVTRPLVVTDPGLAKLPPVGQALDILRGANLAAQLFTEVKPNPTESNVAAGLAALRAGGHDGVVALGGGSALDAGKAIAFVGGQSRPMWDFEDVGDNWKRADPAGILPVVAVPTTAGTGSETGRAAVILNEATHTKVVVFHPRMMPRIVIADPALTVGLPANLTAWTGMDAFAHCLEAYLAPGFHPYADGIALEGMRLIRTSLPAAFADGRDLTARAAMLAASQMGSTAFQKGLGAIHALSHPIGAAYDTHHGLTNAVVMPYVLAFNRAAIGPKAAHIARVLDLARPGFDGLFDFVLELRHRLGIPATIAALGVPAGDLDRLAERAAVDPTAAGNPVPAGVPEMRRMLQAAFDGRL
jgi:alcohol dehydrogenase class IV